jgi:hypothetical protein
MASLYIDREECIGDSLVKINSNFSDLDSSVASNYTTLDTKINSTSAAAITLTTNLSTNLQNTSPGMAKAWVNFNGNTNTINCRYNIQSVTGGGGVYNITYSVPVGINNCVVAAAADNGGGYTATVQTQSSTGCTVHTWRASPLNTTASSNINVVVFGV